MIVNKKKEAKVVDDAGSVVIHAKEKINMYD